MIEKDECQIQTQRAARLLHEVLEVSSLDASIREFRIGLDVNVAGSFDLERVASYPSRRK